MNGHRTERAARPALKLRFLHSCSSRDLRQRLSKVHVKYGLPVEGAFSTFVVSNGVRAGPSIAAIHSMVGCVFKQSSNTGERGRNDVDKSVACEAHS